MKLGLWIDDERSAKQWCVSQEDNTFWVQAFDYEGAIALIEAHFKHLGSPLFDYISLDHDLGAGKTGYDIIKWLEEKIAEEHNDISTDLIYINLCPILTCHSMNPIGKKNINAAINNINKMIDGWNSDKKED